MFSLSFNVIYFIQHVEVFVDKGQEMLNLKPILELEFSVLGILIEGVKQKAYASANTLL